jgi:hypothetical protein
MRDFVAIARAVTPWLRLRAPSKSKIREACNLGHYITAMRRWQPFAESDQAYTVKRRRRCVEPSDDLPTVLIQEVESRTAADVVEIIYLENDTDQTCVATVRADFWTTVDDATGAAAHHGPAPTEVELAPGERARIGDILGWEWDSVLGLNIEFHHGASDGGLKVSYDLKRRGCGRHVAALGEVHEVPGALLEG